jgi:DNA repair photolyase
VKALHPGTTQTPAAGARPIALFRGRGAVTNLQGRFETWQREAHDDGWEPNRDAAQAAADTGCDTELARQLRTSVAHEYAKTILTRNQSPDIPFDVSLNPYRGCEHGCVYCYARPSHSFLGLSPGLDFETRLYAKMNAAALLRAELAKPGYEPKPIAIGVNTDAYQPIERDLRITRSVLEVLVEHRHAFTLITKSSLIERDLDLIGPAARDNLTRVAVSVTTLDHELARRLEPRAASPERRLRTIRTLADAGVPVSVCVAPLIPFINDGDLEEILDRGAEAGATYAHYVILRLPNELDPIFQQWLSTHYPDRMARVLARMRDMRAGKINNSAFGQRMRGTGIWSELYRQRFMHRTERLGLNRERRDLNDAAFRLPEDASTTSDQLDLFAS